MSDGGFSAHQLSPCMGEEYVARRRRERYAAMGRKIARRDGELLDRLAR
ncbi:hypothetical protein [Microtetraspora fusca]|nr:hypothetical protein [Microtetraspora fusca]